MRAIVVITLCVMSGYSHAFEFLGESFAHPLVTRSVTATLVVAERPR
jgi:hypothetical protein